MLVYFVQDLPLSEWAVENCAAMGMTRATKCQWKAIPHILKGKDVVCRAKTGSGKTAAFALPILEHLSQDPYGIFALILSPTRELACQIGDSFTALSANTGFKIHVTTGGTSYVDNADALSKRPNILIATPGRLGDLIRGNLEFPVEDLKYLVLDEADELLYSKSFEADLASILDLIPKRKDRQTLLFSATLNTAMKEIFQILQMKPAPRRHKKFRPDPATYGPSTNPNEKTIGEIGEAMWNHNVVFIETTTEVLTAASNIRQTYCFVPEMTKESYLVALCTENEAIARDKKPVIIFVSTREYTAILARMLRRFGLNVAELHGAMKQKQRLSELMLFRAGRCNILMATDVAARGLDIPRV